VAGRVLARAPIGAEEELAFGGQAQRQILQEGGDFVTAAVVTQRGLDLVVRGMAGHQPKWGSFAVALADHLDLA
jgi:hypothetical protein